MKKYAGILVALLISVLSVKAQTAERYEIDPAHAFVNFTIAHFGGKARGSFDEVAGTIVYDEKEVTRSSVEVVIETAGIYTGNGRRDTHLRSADFFEVDKYPEATQEQTCRKEGYRLSGHR